MARINFLFLFFQSYFSQRTDFFFRFYIFLIIKEWEYLGVRDRTPRLGVMGSSTGPLDPESRSSVPDRTRTSPMRWSGGGQHRVPKAREGEGTRWGMTGMGGLGGGFPENIFFFNFE